MPYDTNLQMPLTTYKKVVEPIISNITSKDDYVIPLYSNVGQGTSADGTRSMINADTINQKIVLTAWSDGTVHVSDRN